MDIKGKVHEVLSTQEVSATFNKRELIIEFAENPQYPEYIKFEALQDKTKLLDELRAGDEVEVFFNLRGRPWTDKNGKTSYFNSLVVWKVNVLKTTAGQQQAPPQQNVPPGTPPAQQGSIDYSQGMPPEDDLPF